jgi:hypothetical protein
VTSKTHSAHRPAKPQHHEAAESAPEPIKQTPAQPPADRFKTAVDEIADLVSDKYPISAQVQAIIRRARNG